MFSGLDWFPTLVAAAGNPDVKGRLLKGDDINGQTFKVHLDGFNQLPLLTGQEPAGARNEFAYYNDDGVLVDFRHENWKGVFMRDGKAGRLCRLVHAVHLSAHSQTVQSSYGPDGAGRHRFRPVRRLARQERLFDGLDHLPRADFLETFVAHPPSQEPASFTIDQVAKDVEEQIKAMAKHPPGG